MTGLEQLVFDLDVSPMGDTPGPAVKRNVSAGPAKLLRRLVTLGLDPQAIERAAELCVALDEEAAS